jgi:hypothetical protein
VRIRSRRLLESTLALFESRVLDAREYKGKHVADPMDGGRSPAMPARADQEEHSEPLTPDLPRVARSFDLRGREDRRDQGTRATESVGGSCSGIRQNMSLSENCTVRGTGVLVSPCNGSPRRDTSSMLTRRDCGGGGQT